MNIDYLRAKALAYAPELPYPIVLDRELKYRLSEAQANLAAARRERDAILADPELLRARREQTLADLTPKLAVDDTVAAAEAALTDAEEAARPESLVLIFRRISAQEYQAMLEAHSDDKGTVRLLEFADALLAACYVRTEAADGSDVGLTFEQAMGPCDHGDLEALRGQIVGHHRVGASVSFDPRNSGRPATS